MASWKTMEDVMSPITQRSCSFDAGYETAEEEFAAMHEAFVQSTETFAEKVRLRTLDDVQAKFAAGGQRGMEATAFPAGGQRGNEDATAAEIERDLHVSQAQQGGGVCLIQILSLENTPTLFPTPVVVFSLVFRINLFRECGLVFRINLFRKCVV